VFTDVGSTIVPPAKLAVTLGSLTMRMPIGPVRPTGVMNSELG
jgi:hypothetical protein